MPIIQLFVHGWIHRNYVITKIGMVSVYGVTSIYHTMSFEIVYWENVSRFTVTNNECGIHYMPKDSPHPQALVLFGFDISNCDPKVSSTQSILVPTTYNIEVSSTTNLPEPQSSTWSPCVTLSLVSANPHSYLKPAHPPPNTIRLTAYLSGFLDSNFSICFFAASVISNGFMTVIMTSYCL